MVLNMKTADRSGAPGGAFLCWGTWLDIIEFKSVDLEVSVCAQGMEVRMYVRERVCKGV